MDAWLVGPSDGATPQQSIAASSGTQSPALGLVDDPALMRPGCSGGYEFTPLFEETVLSIVPSVCFVILAVLRILFLWNRKTVITGNCILKFSKLVSGRLI